MASEFNSSKNDYPKEKIKEKIEEFEERINQPPAVDINKPKQMGRTERKLTYKEWERAQNMASIMCTGEEIAHVLRISYDTLVKEVKSIGYKSFPDWFKEHSSKGKMSLRRKQFEMAERNAAMAIWLGKQYLGQSDKLEQQTQAQIVQVKYSDDQVEKAIEAAKKFKESQE